MQAYRSAELAYLGDRKINDEIHIGAPYFEDLERGQEFKAPVESDGGLCTLHAETFSDKNDGPDLARIKVLDWRFSALMC